MDIFRVENEAGIGPYAADYKRWKEPLPDNTRVTPTAQWDGLPPPEFEHRFAFKSIDQLLDWFDLWIVALEEADFRVVRIWVHEDVDDVTFGRKQLMFRENGQERTVIPWERVKQLL